MMSYTRVDVALGCEMQGFGFKGRSPVGRCVLQTQGTGGKLTVWAQDLRPEQRYTVWLIFANEEGFAGVMLDVLPVDVRGRGEIRREFTGAELYGFDIANVAAIVVIASASNGIKSPLCGYPAGRVAWRENFFDLKNMQSLTNAVDRELPIEPEHIDEETPLVEQAALVEPEQIDGETPLVEQAALVEPEQIDEEIP